MSGLMALLTVQELDLEADQLQARREHLAASRELADRAAELGELDAALAALRQRREELARAERALGIEVEAVASKAHDVDATLYSGRVKIPKELEALQDDLEMLRRQQAQLEDLELQQLEAIETVEGEIAERDSHRARTAASVAELEAALDLAEDEIRARLARIAKTRAEVAAGLPVAVLQVYDRLRGNQRFAGRAAVRLRKGICEGCRIQLPTSEHGRIRMEPPNAVVCCAGCGRLLVR